MTTMRLPDFLTREQINRALKIWVHDPTNFHARVLHEIVAPAMPEINRKLGQRNVPEFLVYVIEYVFTESQR